MPGIKVGDGYIEVHADTDAVAGEVAQTESKSQGPADKAGTGIGKTLVAGIGGAFVGLKLGELISGAVDQSAITANLQAQLSGTSKVVSAQAGKAAGEVFAQGYGESMEDVNTAIVGIQNNLGGLAKYSQGQTQSMAKDALGIASVYGDDVSDVIKSAGALMKNGLAKNSQEAFDIISKGYQSGLNNSGEFLDSLNEYAEPLHALGLDGRESLAIFKKSIDDGAFSIDKAGDAMNEFATRSIDGSSSTMGAYKALGVNGQDMMERIAKGGDSALFATSETIEKIKAMKDPVAQNQVGAALFGSMWEDAGKKTIFALDPALAKMGKVEGATKKMNTANTSAASKVESMKRGFDQWKNSLIQTNGPLGNATAFLGTMGPEGIAAGAGIVTASKGLLDMGISAAKGAVGLFTHSAALDTEAASTGLATTGAWAFTAALLANPITWIVVGIVALIAAIVLLIANWGTVVTFITDTWSNFMAWIQPALTAVGDWFAGLWQGIKDTAAAVWDWIVSAVTTYFQVTFLGLQAIGAAISGWWNGFWNGTKNTAVAIWGLITGAVSSAFTNVRNFMGSMGDSIRGAWDGIVGWVGGLGGRITSATSGMWNGISSAFKSAINSVIRGWNALKFGIPAIHAGPINFDGFSVGTPQIPYLARGTNFFGGGMAVVGENGPELVSMPTGAQVIPNGRTEKMLGGGGDSGSVTNNVTNNITINEAEDPMGSAGRVDSVLRKWAKK